jgi:hypothetical protein
MCGRGVPPRLGGRQVNLAEVVMDLFSGNQNIRLAR